MKTMINVVRRDNNNNDVEVNVSVTLDRDGDVYAVVASPVQGVFAVSEGEPIELTDEENEIAINILK